MEINLYIIMVINMDMNTTPITLEIRIMDIATEIKKLKREKNAIVLAHNYQRPEIYDIADFIGDSLDLSRAAAKTDADVIVFCGVDFMAESAKLLNPEKTVLLPDIEARCPMAAMVTVDALRRMKVEYPDAASVCYINTSAAVKAECDVCCTSANAVKIVNSIPNEKIIFVPDRHLGKWVQKQTRKKLILWDGYCYVHSAVNANDLDELKKEHPKAKVIAHPETPEVVLALADYVAGTEGMVKIAKEDEAEEFIVVTEQGMLERLKKEAPGKRFFAGAGMCVNQKKITLDKVKDALRLNQHQIEIPEDVAMKARKALERMLDMGK